MDMITRQEVERREQAAIADIGGTALYHANRLPASSEWHEAVAGVAQIFGFFPDREPDEELELTVPEGSRGRGHLQVVV